MVSTKWSGRNSFKVEMSGSSPTTTTVMKKLLLSLLMLLCVACQEFDFDYAHKVANGTIRKQEYTEVFTQEFGTYGVLNIDGSHDWGFTDFPTLDIPETRSVDPNSNEWYIVPDPVTSEEAIYVTNWFNTHQYPETMAVDWSDFFVQQVYKGHSNMDHLIAGNDHVYNFNSTTGSIQLIQNGSSNIFGYNNSTDSKEHYEYTLQYIRGAFYVGFDFYANGQNPNQQEARDGYYSDWIVKITPCLPKDNYGKRIMCEDLGAIGDFDFNDVVFDCYVNYNEYWHGNDFGIVILRAAGGTMPLYVDGHEVHEMFGVDVSHITNTFNKNEYPPIIFRVNNVTSPNPKDITIHVINTQEHSEYDITSDLGEAPGKICVPITVDWTDEYQNIKDKYPKFPLWVQDKNIPFWE